MQTDLTFLKTLREKLKGGNARSIHLNALPGRYATRFDLFGLNQIRENLADEFLDQLLSKSKFSFDISFDGINLNELDDDEQKKLGLVAKRLNSIYYENEDTFKEHGIRTFAFGYPLVVKRSNQDRNKTIKAPLLIWSLELEKSFKKTNTWKIKKDEDNPIFINEVLISHLASDENITIEQLPEDFLDDSLIDKDELVEITFNFLQKFSSGIPISSQESISQKANEPVQKTPERDTLDNLANNIPLIQWSGIFGLFRTQKETIITDLDKLIEKHEEFEFENLKIEHFPSSPFSSVKTDPSQQEILNTLSEWSNKVIQGPPGTGKSQSLTALITNALSNKFKCLVICEKQTALGVIQKNLYELDNDKGKIGDLSVIIDDIAKDRMRVVNSVRARAESFRTNYTSATNSEYYSLLEKKFFDDIKHLNGQHKILDNKLFQGKNWTALVGTFLSKQRHNDYKLLNDELSYKDFTFEDKELFGIIEHINEAKELFLNVETLEHPLDNLHLANFESENPTALQFEINKNLTNLLSELTELQKQINDLISAYRKQVSQHYNQYYTQLKSECEATIQFLQTNISEYGGNFWKQDKFTKNKIALFSVFSKKYKSIKVNRATIPEKINDLSTLHNKHEYFDFQFSDDNQVESTALLEELKGYKQRNNNWFEKIEEIKAALYEDFSEQNFHHSFQNKDTATKLAESFDNILASIQQNKIINSHNGSPIANFKKSLEAIASLQESIKSVQKNIEDFKDFYYWKRFFLKLNSAQQKIITALIRLNTEDWVGTFESWYFYWLLSSNDNEKLPRNDKKIDEIIETKESLSKIQLDLIAQFWQSKQKASAKAVSIPSLYNKRGSKGQRRNSLRKIIQANFELFTDFFPVMLINPSVCSSILPLTEGLFDIVVFDEASQLRLEDTFPALVRGKFKIISGDSQQMPPSSYFEGGAALLEFSDEELKEELLDETVNEVSKKETSLNLAFSESLLEYGLSSKFKESFLKVHYRSNHPYLIDFSNAAFYGNRLVPMPAKQDYKPIKFIQVDGQYESHVNEDEAEQVVQILLNQIKPNKKKEYPSVGIATFNIYQRNLILEEINKARRLSPEHDRQLEQLDKAGMFVKNLENIQGDERDIIIISTTFGYRPDGKFYQNFGPVSRKNGYKLLNVIVTRAKYRVYMCTSIPSEKYRGYSNIVRQTGNVGNGALYAYLSYARAIDENNEEVRKSILNLLYDKCTNKSFAPDDSFTGTESPFEEEVVIELSKRVDSSRIELQHECGGFRIDIILKSKKTGKPAIAIECDGAKYHSSPEAYAWDMFRQEQLENQGFKFHRIWSTNWWNNTEKEVKRLVDFIHQFDLQESKEEIKESELAPYLIDFAPEEIRPKPKEKKKITTNSIVTIRNQDNVVFKVKFIKTQSKQPIKIVPNQVASIYDKSPLAIELLDREEGEKFQLGLFEVYYEILNVE